MAKNNLFIFILFFCLGFLLLKPARGQLVPIKGLPLYDEYRKEILSLGWLPKEYTEISVYGRPELLCGNTFCSATFISPNRKEILELSVWFKVLPGKIEYYVAPAFEIMDCTEKQNEQWCK
jgi:hypothetical protein